MRWSSHSCVLLALAGLALLLGPQPGHAQQKGKKVSFNTGDGVELSGTFYAGNKDYATVMVLHAIGKGEDSHKKGYDSLAAALQKKGYSVLTFDFRGHGDSTTVDPKKFWSPLYPNRTHVKANPADPGTISVEQFNPAYYPTLVNDIAAAKSYLDRRNDAGECNSSALVVLGAETGATLGAIWMNSEWYRFKVLAPAAQAPYPHLDSEPEGKATVAAFFLTISPTLGKKSVNLPAILRVPGQVKGVPMVFAYGDLDKKGEDEAKKLEKFLKAARLKKQAFTGVYPVVGAGKATGRDLLRGGKTEGDVIAYLDAVLAKTPEWINRDFQKSPYLWTFRTPGPGGQIPPGYTEAKAADELTIHFTSYERFMPSR